MTDTMLETARVRLRPFELDDLDALEGILGDARTMRFYPQPFTRGACRRWIEWNVGSYALHGFGLWAMELKETGELVGDCGLVVQEVDGDDMVEVGWHVHRAHWGQGLAPEAGAACRDHAFRDLGLERVVSLIRPENTASRRVAEKIGMTVWRETEHSGLHHLVYAVASDDLGPAPRAPEGGR